VGISAETAAGALLESWRQLANAMPEGWSRDIEGAVGMVTGVRGPALNGVWVERLDADPALIADLLDAVEAAGFGCCLQYRPDADAGIAGVAIARGMIRDDDVPLMVFEGPSSPDTPALDPRLQIRQLEMDEGHLAAQTASEGFEAPIEPFLAMATPSVLRYPGVRYYLGAVDGEPVTTGVGVTFGDSVGIFNIATPPPHRRHGYGAAVTRRAVADGLAAGATWAWLQSSTDGYAVYERLGFRTVERWHCWVANQ
jgi:hypothetical protein